MNDGYTPAQRRLIDARLTRALRDVKKGRLYGPFETIQEMAAPLRKNSEKLKAKKNPSARG